MDFIVYLSFQKEFTLTKERMDEKKGKNQKGKPLDTVTVQFTEPSCYLSKKMIVAITFTNLVHWGP